jgi:hypothetical protein
VRFDAPCPFCYFRLKRFRGNVWRAMWWYLSFRNELTLEHCELQIFFILFLFFSDSHWMSVAAVPRVITCQPRMISTDCKTSIWRGDCICLDCVLFF